MFENLAMVNEIVGENEVSVYLLEEKRDIVVKANKNYIKLLSDELNQKEVDKRIESQRVKKLDKEY